MLSEVSATSLVQTSVVLCKLALNLIPVQLHLGLELKIIMSSKPKCSLKFYVYFLSVKCIQLTIDFGHFGRKYGMGFAFQLLN